MADHPGPRREAVTWDVVHHDAETIVSETPIYDFRTDALYWMSLYEPALKRLGLRDAAFTSWPLPSEYVGTYALYDDGTGALVAAATGIHGLDFTTGAVSLVHEAPYDQAESRFNDGRCDPRGRFWVGTFSPRLAAGPQGREWYYRVDADGISPVLDGMTIANGTAFSPDGSLMYVADRVNGRILVYDYDLDSGVPSNPRTFVEIDPGESPDGAAVDSRGGYWTAIYGSGEVRRYAPDGRLDRVIVTPVSNPTMCAFGGPNLDRLFLTSSRLRMTPEEIGLDPLAGAVFCADVGEIGMSEPFFPRGVAAKILDSTVTRAPLA